MFNTKIAKFKTENGDNILYPFSPPIFQTEVDSNFTKELIEEGRKLTKEEDDWNYQLAGNLKYGRSYNYKEDYTLKVEPYLKTYVERFFNGIIEQYGNDTILLNKFLNIQKGRRELQSGQLRLDTMWINFSQKHDFNPPHTHLGELSFVIFCKVPKEIFEVQADSNTQRAGELHFQYGEPITTLMGSEFPIEPYENLMFIFPSKLKHFVPAYWVDAERISVSGNFVVV
ncbi:2OG-Fe(II) oxygenase family protein [bacterium]|nr:2OG-Fe(II) oxygenase family protein [bacterium]MDA9881774.1 2OG-Fe(II) oxygenase family protein [Crocinitomicaceae bacterium]